jgi:hypothetical protein
MLDTCAGAWGGKGSIAAVPVNGGNAPKAVIY